MKFDKQTLILMAVVGVVAGYLASWLVGGSGLLRYLVTGVLGSFVGGILLNATGVNLGIKNELANQVATAAIGAVVVSLLLHFI